jgi:hypothetical protein
VAALGGVKAEGVGDGIDDRPRRVAVSALLDPGQVLDADPGARGKLGPPQPGRPAALLGRDPKVFGAGPVPFRADEFSQWRAHAAKAMSAPRQVRAVGVALRGPAWLRPGS